METSGETCLRESVHKTSRSALLTDQTTFNSRSMAEFPLPLPAIVVRAHVMPPNLCFRGSPTLGGQ